MFPFPYFLRVLFERICSEVRKDASFGLTLIDITSSLKVIRGYVFAGVAVQVDIGMFVNNFPSPIQARLSPDFVSDTRGNRGRGD